MRCCAVPVRCRCAVPVPVHGSLVLICPLSDDSRRVRVLKCGMQSELPSARGQQCGQCQIHAGPVGSAAATSTALVHVRPAACMPTRLLASVLACPFTCSLLAGTHPRPRSHTCTHAHARIMMHDRTHARVCAPTPALACTPAHSWWYACTHAFACTHLLLLTCAHARARAHACTSYARILARSRAYTHPRSLTCMRLGRKHTTMAACWCTPAGACMRACYCPVLRKRSGHGTSGF